MTARRINKPAIQGELDGACGFYAISNAINLLEPDLEKSDVFRIAWASFLEDGDPMRVIEGTTRGNLKNIISRTVGFINKNYALSSKDGSNYRLGFSIPFWHHDKLRDRKKVIDTINQADYRNGSVAIIGYKHSSLPLSMDEYYHWTVIREMNDNKLITYDSSYESSQIDLDSVRVDSLSLDYHSARPYNIFSQNVFLIQKTYD